MTTVVSVAQGGTGANSAALARTALGVPPSAAYDQANTARDQANTAYAQANSAYSDANTRLSASGGTLAGDLIITGNLTVSGNSTTLNAEILTIEDADVVLLSNVASTPALNAGIIVNRGTSTNTFLRWDEVTDKWGWSDDGSTTYKFNSALDAYAQANSAYGAANNRVLKAGDTMTGNLTFSGTGLRILGDMSNATWNNRLAFQTSTANGSTALLVIPNGTATISQYTAWGNADLTNASYVQLVQLGATETRLGAGIQGTGTYTPITVYTGGSERMRIASNGFIGFGTTSPTNKFHVSGGTDDGRVAITNNDRGNGYANGFWIGVDSSQSYLLSRDSYPLTFFTNATKRMTIDENGSVYTEVGSAISYGSGETYNIWSDEPEYSIAHSDANWKDMKTFICSKSGNLKFKFSAYISSGTYYWAWRILKNGSTVAASGYFQNPDVGESASVHAYRRFVASVGPIAAGDSLVLQMISSSGGGTPVTGVGQTLYAKEFRAYSTVPNVEHGGSTNIWGTRVGIGTTSPNIKLHVVSGAGANYSSTVNKSNNMFGISVTSTTNADTMQGIWFASGTDGAGTHWSGIVGARENNAAHWGTKLVFYTHDQNTNNLDQANERLAITGFGGFHRRYKTEHFILREFAELGSNFDNPTQNIITLPTTGSTNSVLIVKVIVRQVTYGSAFGNEHIGYARAMWNGSSWDLNVSTMSVVGNANLANVGTLSWSTRTLVYTSNRGSNYDNYLVSYEVFNPAQVNLTYVF